MYFYGTSGEVAAFRTQAESFPDISGYVADCLPQNAVPPWQRIYNQGSESVADGALTVTTSTAGLQQAYRLSGGPASAWNPTSRGSVLEAKLRVDSQAGSYANAILISTGNRSWSIGFGMTGLTEILGSGSVAMTTNDAFHVYRFTIDGTNGPLKVYVDGNTTPIATWAGVSSTANRIDFGDFLSSAAGVVKWCYIRWTNQGVCLP